MASSTSSAAVAALVQKASQQYLDCRRKVTAKVEEVKALDHEINALFSQITALGESAGSSSKSVGRLEVRIAGVEGETPVENAVITVALDPEYEADDDAFELVEVQHVIEKHTVTVTAVTADGEEEVVAEKVITKENGVEVGVEIIKEDTVGSGDEAEHDHAHVKRKTTTKIARTVQTRKIKQKVEKKEPPVRSVEWTPEVDSAAFPATFVFDPVQSREAVVTITVAAAKDDEPEAEPVKEIEFPVSSLFQGKDLDQWYTIKDEAAVEETAVEETADEQDAETTITEIVGDATADAEDAAAAVETAEEESKVEAETETVEAETENAETVEAETENAENVETAETENAENVETAETENAEGETEATEAAETAEVERVEEAKGASEEDAKADVPAAAAVTRFHVQATFVLSEIETLSLEAVNLSKKKQEAEAVLAILEREAASLRTKYERLNASQRSLGASSVSKPKPSMLLGGRTFAGQPPAPKSSYQKLKDSVSSVLTPQRQQVAISVAMFFGSAVLFHFQGENLLA